MKEWIEDYFLTRPTRLAVLGHLLVKFGLGLILVGMIGHVAASFPRILSSVGGQRTVARTLAEIYPTLPTWWVPESIFGGTLAITILLAGLWAARVGQRIDCLR